MNWVGCLPALLSPLLAMAVAQPSSPGTTNKEYPYERFSTSMAIIIVVLIAALFLMGFLSIYIRHCSDYSYGGPIGSIRRVFSRHAAAAHGLDPSVLEAFPTFAYSEVREHKIGKGGVECAICLNEFDAGDTLRLIPKCDHVFHPDCIDAWLECHVTCPVCRADLVPDPVVSDHLQESNHPPPPPPADNLRIIRSESDQSSVQVDRVSSRTARTANLTRAKVVFGLRRFRSHSTGHSMGMVQPLENLERFTLKLPVQVRKEVMDRAMLNRTGSCAVPGLPRGGSSRSNRWRSYLRIEREGRPDRWPIFARGLSVKSTQVMAEAGEGSDGVGGRKQFKTPSFKCLEPKAADETGMFSPELDARSPV